MAFVQLVYLVKVLSSGLLEINFLRENSFTRKARCRRCVRLKVINVGYCAFYNFDFGEKYFTMFKINNKVEQSMIYRFLTNIKC